MLVGAAIFTLMTTWQRGREIVSRRLREVSMPLPQLIQRLQQGSVARVPGTAVFLTSHTEGVPHTLLHNLKPNEVLRGRAGHPGGAVAAFPRRTEARSQERRSQGAESGRSGHLCHHQRRAGNTAR